MAQTEVQQETTLSAEIIRCRCGLPATHTGQVCPKGERVELGLVSYSHTDPVKNALGQARVKLNDIKTRKLRNGG